MVVVEDATRDAQVAGDPLVSGPQALRFYAGVPLRTPRGVVLGALCVLDVRARPLSPKGERALQLLADEVMLVLENRRELIELRRSEGLRQEAVEALLATKTDLEKRIELRTREVEAAHERLHRTLARVSDGFVALDRQWRYTYVNERAGQMLSARAGGLAGQPFFSELVDEVGQPLQRGCEVAMRDQLVVTVTSHQASSDRWFESRIYPSPEGVTLFIAEITQQRRAEEALKDTARRLAEAQAVAHVGSWEWSVAENRVVWSDEMYRVYGVSREQFSGSYEAFLSRVYVEDLEYTRAVVSDAYANPKRFVYDHRIVRGDGAVRMLHTVGQTLADSDGRALRMVGTCWDTTEQWLAMQALEGAATVVQSLVDAVPDAVLITDRQGHLRALNDKLIKLFALPASLTLKESDAAPLRYIAQRLRDHSAFWAHVEQARAQPAEVLRGRFELEGAGAIDWVSRPYGGAAGPFGRIWTFARVSGG
jgi:PAS domain-containing protein